MSHIYAEDPYNFPLERYLFHMPFTKKYGTPLTSPRLCIPFFNTGMELMNDIQGESGIAGRDTDHTCNPKKVIHFRRSLPLQAIKEYPPLPVQLGFRLDSKQTVKRELDNLSSRSVPTPIKLQVLEYFRTQTALFCQNKRVHLGSRWGLWNRVGFPQKSN